MQYNNPWDHMMLMSALQLHHRHHASNDGAGLLRTLFRHSAAALRHTFSPASARASTDPRQPLSMRRQPARTVFSYSGANNAPKPAAPSEQPSRA